MRPPAQRKPAPSGLNITAISGARVGSILCTTAFGSRYMYWEYDPQSPGASESGTSGGYSSR